MGAAVVAAALGALGALANAAFPYGPVRVNKCCEPPDLMADGHCTPARTLDADRWSPMFSSENGNDNVQIEGYQFVIGMPACETTQHWSVYHYANSHDQLILLANGKMRHFTHRDKYLEKLEEKQSVKIFGRLNEPLPELKTEKTEPYYYDYEPGQYCMDKIINENNVTGLYAVVCPPIIDTNWGNPDFLMRKLINPLLHIVGIICFLITAIIYFILPTLRDLTGNIVTTINVCLIISQVSDLVRIFTEFSSHVSFIVADTVLYVSLLGAFFWLNSLGYYIWKTFKSRNVFLRVTDGRKYCYYMIYAWGSTILMCGLALFAHFMLDSGSKKESEHSSNSFITNGDQETIGWLGIAVFFTPIAFTIIVNIFFYITTLKVINRMNTYGRIHHKLKHNFDMFLLMFIVMSMCWLFFILSWFPYNGLMYTHIFVNALQGPFILYICVLRQAHVMFLLRKSCCYNEPVPTNDWGDEMTQMNGSSY